MKLSDFVIRYLEKKTDSVFLLSGGGIMHLVDSLGKSRLHAYCCHHEQAAAIAAEGYARIKNDIGVVLVTSGPGATNAITGAAGAWLDSIPMLIISGQAKTDNMLPRKNGIPLIRQLGFQELNVIDMVKPITKYAVTVLDREKIRYHLEKALYLAKSGRPGPVWLEIPLDIQASELEVENLEKFTPPPTDTYQEVPMKEIIDRLENAKRPLLMAGNGIRLSGGTEILWRVLHKLKINVVTPIFTASDLVTEEYPYYLGRQGIPGIESANYALDNCDLLLVIGERLQLTQTSYDYDNFAKDAFVIMVDIDKEEMRKKTIHVDIPVYADAKVFLEKLYQQNITLHKWKVIKTKINPADYQITKKYLNVYRFTEELNKHLDGCSITTADAMASLVTNQAAKLVKGQRLLTNAGLGHMGSGLPLAIGACIASGGKPTICMEGDGSLMLNIQELQTVIHHRLPIKLFIFNNGGYYSIRNTHLAYFGRVFSADSKTGVTLPNFQKLVRAWGLKYIQIGKDRESHRVKEVMESKGPVVCELMIDPNQPMLPKWTAGKYRKN